MSAGAAVSQGMTTANEPGDTDPAAGGDASLLAGDHSSTGTGGSTGSDSAGAAIARDLIRCDLARFTSEAARLRTAA